MPAPVGGGMVWQVGLPGGRLAGDRVDERCKFVLDLRITNSIALGLVAPHHMSQPVFQGMPRHPNAFVVFPDKQLVRFHQGPWSDAR